MPVALFIGALDQFIGHIEAGRFCPDTFYFAILFNEANGFARYAQADTHLRTKRDIVEIFSQGADDIGVEFMATVVAHRLAQQTAADAEGDFIVIGIVRHGLYQLL